MHKYTLDTVEDGIDRLRNGSLDIIIADTPILDYYRATDHGCKLQKIGDIINEDTYAIGMVKGFPLKVYYIYSHISDTHIFTDILVIICIPSLSADSFKQNANI